jgi:hypothetical protein
MNMVCHCTSTIQQILVCTKTETDKLLVCQQSLLTATNQWNSWVKQIKDAVWKLPVSLEEYHTAFQKNVKIYQEKLEAVQTMNSQGYYLRDIPLFEWSIPTHIMVRYKNKLFVMTTRFQEFIDTYPDKPWSWYGLSRNPNITLEQVEKYPDKPWNWYGLSWNPNVTMEMVEKYHDKPWNWDGLSRNPNVTLEWVEKYPDKPWDWYWISENPNMTLEIIEKYPDKPWSWKGLSQNLFELN